MSREASIATLEPSSVGPVGVTGSAALLEKLRGSLREAQEHVLDHTIYRELSSIEDLITFTEYHVYAVWDFMLLLKWLQREFTSVELPWLPPSSNLACRLVNEIVLGEESDAIGDEYMSHFELYVDAMEELGADTRPIRSFIKLLADGVSVPDALDRAGVPAAAAAFVNNTWDIVTTKQPHEIAAAFALTRENLIPEMFEKVIAAEAVGRDRMQRFVVYLERHIELDADEHTPMAFELLKELCGNDACKWNECVAVSERCFRARYELWSGVSAEVANRGNHRHASCFDVLARLELPGLADTGEAELVVEGERLQLWSRDAVDAHGPSRCRFELSLPGGVKADDLSAAVRNGVLEIRVQRTTKEPATKVAVLKL